MVMDVSQPRFDFDREIRCFHLLRDRVGQFLFVLGRTVDVDSPTWHESEDEEWKAAM